MVSTLGKLGGFLSVVEPTAWLSIKEVLAERSQTRVKFCNPRTKIIWPLPDERRAIC